MAEVTPVVKRRGRKPKDLSSSLIKSSSIIDSFNGLKPLTDQNVHEVTQSNVNNVPPKEKSKRGRKPKHVIYANEEVLCDEESVGGVTNTSDDENIIVCLNVNTTSQFSSNQDTTYGDEQPYAYNHDTYNNIPLLSHEDNNPNVFIQSFSNNSNHSSSETVKVVNILKDFEEKNKQNEWPINTSISCYWCCHRFDNAPFGIPIGLNNDTFEVFGCFCSLECAAAYNFSTNESQDEMWERYQLINMISRKMNLGKLVKSAPPRLSLKMFGGYMEIDQFRKFNGTNKFVNLNFPPMTSVTQQLEEINDFELCNDVKYIPIDNERVNKYKEKITFRRNKPLVDSNKSLESTMNLKYS